MKSRLSSDNIYYIDKRTNKKESKFDVIKRVLKYISRANDSTKTLSRGAKTLASYYAEMLDSSKDGVITLTHDSISAVTDVTNRQNNNIHTELTDIFDIQYHYLFAKNEQTMRNVFAISYTKIGKEILENPLLFFSCNKDKYCHLTTRQLPLNKKKITTSIYIDENTLKNNTLEKDNTVQREESVRATPAVYEQVNNESTNNEAELSFCFDSSFFQETVQVASLPAARELKEWAAEIDDATLANINKQAGREDFTNHPPFERHFIEKLMTKLSKPENKFHAKQAVVNYLVKALENEKVSHHQANNPSFTLSTKEQRVIDEYWRKRDEKHYQKHANRASSDAEANPIEAILGGLEVVSDEEYAVAKQKEQEQEAAERAKETEEYKEVLLNAFIAGAFDEYRTTAIWSHVRVDCESDNKVVLHIKENFKLSDEEKDKLKNCVRKAYGDNVQIMAKAVTVTKRVSKGYQEDHRTPTWNAMRKDLIARLGDGVVKSWFDKSRVTESEKPKEVRLEMSEFFASYIYDNYKVALEALVKKYGRYVRLVYKDYQNAERSNIFYGQTIDEEFYKI